MPQPPATDEGWYVLHDLRRIDWDDWRNATGPERDRAISAGREYLESAAAIEDAEEGATGVYAMLGHEADLMVVHLRPTLGDLDALERRFAGTDFAGFTERTGSYVSVTEASGYTGAQDYFDPEAEADPGITRYIESRLYPDVPDAEFVSFYPMDKRRDPDHNWYDLSFEERADYMAAHGEIGRQYAGRVNQIISGSIGLDDFEWGVTLFADDPTDVKELLYEMRFDPSSSRFAEFGPFYSGRRFPPADLGAFMAGESIPTEEIGEDGGAAGDEDAGAGLDEELEALGADVPASGHAVLVRSDADVETLREAVDGLRGNFEHYDTHLGTEVLAPGEDEASSVVVSTWETASAAETASGFLADLEGATETTVGPVGDAGGSEDGAGSDATSAAAPARDDGDGTLSDGATAGDEAAAGIRETLAEQGIYAGQPHGEDVYALVVYSDADVEELAGEVEDLTSGFDRYDTHRGTDLYEADGAEHAVVSLWDTEDAAETAGDYLSDLPGVVRQAGEGGGFGTMGMFYAVKPEHREAFVDTFQTVGALLAEMDGHRETVRYENRADENDMFIASRWDAKEDAMAFFRSEEFAETVEWGRDVLADRPRHVFLA